MYIGKLLLRGVDESELSRVEQLLQDAGDNDLVSNVLSGVTQIEEIVIFADERDVVARGDDGFSRIDRYWSPGSILVSYNPRLEKDLKAFGVGFSSRLGGWGYKVNPPIRMETPDLTIKQLNGIIGLQYVGAVIIEPARTK